MSEPQYDCIDMALSHAYDTIEHLKSALKAADELADACSPGSLCRHHVCTYDECSGECYAARKRAMEVLIAYHTIRQTHDKPSEPIFQPAPPEPPSLPGEQDPDGAERAMCIGKVHIIEQAFEADCGASALPNTDRCARHPREERT